MPDTAPTTAPHPIGDTFALKQALRRSIRTQRPIAAPRCGSPEAQEAGQRIAAILDDAVHWSDARCVALYAAVGHELDAEPLATLLRRRGATTCYPRIVGQTPPQLAFHVVRDGQELQPTPHGLLEPAATAALAGPIDVFVVPGLAFDRTGHRLGSGRGYYDAALKSQPDALRVAVGHPFQLVPEVPTEAHDEPVDLIATVAGCLRTAARGWHPLERGAQSVAQATTEDVS